MDPKWSDPFLDHAQAGATCTGLPFFMELTGGGITSKNENPYAREKKNGNGK
jgi:hypothetical protein